MHAERWIEHRTPAHPRATVEHLFRTINLDGRPHFKTTTLERVRTEMSLNVLACKLSCIASSPAP